MPTTIVKMLSIVSNLQCSSSSPTLNISEATENFVDAIQMVELHKYLVHTQQKTIISLQDIFKK